MKPVSFRYFAPRTVDDALDLLAAHGEEGKILAGGQSLVPAMNFRLARPASLIDINRIDALDYVRGWGRVAHWRARPPRSFRGARWGWCARCASAAGCAAHWASSDPLARDILW